MKTNIFVATFLALLTGSLSVDATGQEPVIRKRICADKPVDAGGSCRTECQQGQRQPCLIGVVAFEFFLQIHYRA